MKSGRSMKEFLGVSTIHGFYYLGHAGSVGKAFWLVCVTVSISFAVTFNYLNIVDWLKNPSVVTTVEVIRSENNILFPVITICPKEPFYRNVYPRFFNDPDVVNDPKVAKLRHEYDMSVMATGLTSWVVNNGVESYHFRRLSGKQVLKHFDDKVRSICDGSQVSNVCSFLSLILNFLDNNEAPKTYQAKVQRQTWLYYVVATETARSMYERNEFRVSNVKAVLTEHFIVTEDSMPLNLTEVDEDNLITLLNSFIAATNDKSLVEGCGSFGNPDLDSIGVAPLEELQTNNQFILNLRDLVNYGTYLLGAQKQVIMRDFELLKFVRDAAFAYLGVENSTVNLMEMLAMFDTKELGMRFLPSCLESKQHGRHTDVCSEGGSEAADDCQAYCVFAKTAGSNSTRLAKLIASFYPLTGMPTQANPLTVFPMCPWPGEDETDVNCATELLTDRGKCFAVNMPTRYSTSGAVTRFEDARILKGLHNEQLFVLGNDLHAVFGSPDEFVVAGTDATFSVQQDFEYVIQLTSPLTAVDVVEPKGLHVKHRSSDSFSFEAMESVETTDTIRSKPLSQRMCMYPDDKQLDHFPFYSEANCILECAWRYAASTCQCVPWYLHETLPDRNICRWSGNACFQDILSARFPQRRSKYRQPDEEPEWKQECTTMCLPDCENFHFELTKEGADEVEIPPCEQVDEAYKFSWLTCNYTRYVADEVFPATELQHAVNLKAANFRHDSFSLHPSVFFSKKRTLLRIIKTATWTWIDMLANVGGTLGLFSGFSILSGIEIGYWGFVALLDKTARALKQRARK